MVRESGLAPEVITNSEIVGGDVINVKYKINVLPILYLYGSLKGLYWVLAEGKNTGCVQAGSA
jgi:hypothetical protein